MARNSLNPWPSIADLFSALTVVAFAALIVIAVGATILNANERIERNAARELADIFQKEYKPGSGQPVQAGPCNDRRSDECIEINFRFVRNRAELRPEGVAEVKEACHIYREAVSKLLERTQQHGVPLQPSNLVLLIEGHSDSTIPSVIWENGIKRNLDDREKFLFNWNLSSERAANVLYEFRECGVSSETGYRISSVGLAATRPLCPQANPDESCHEQNRRTTMRIRVERNNAVSASQPTVSIPTHH